MRISDWSSDVCSSDLLAEYRSRADRIADHLPWAALVAPGVVLNKDGTFQRTFRFRGPDLESATAAEMVAACARANNVLNRLGSGRSEERLVGKVCVRTVRSRWSPYH